MEINKLLDNHNTNFGICITDCKVEQKFKNDGLIHTVRKGTLLKIFEYKVNHVELTWIPDKFISDLPNSILVTSKYSYFNLIGLKLFKYLNAINDTKERLNFYQNLERRNFVLSLKENTIVNIIFQQQRIKAVFLKITEKNMKILATVKLLDLSEIHLIEKLNAAGFSIHNQMYSVPGNMIRNLNFTDLKIEEKTKIDINLWECLSCSRENVKKAKYCSYCLTPKYDRTVYPKSVYNDNIDFQKVSFNLLPSAIQPIMSSKQKNYPLSKNSDLSNKYSGLRSNSAPNNNTPLSRNAALAYIPNDASLIDKIINDRKQLIQPLKTFIVPPVNSNENEMPIDFNFNKPKPNGNVLIVYNNHDKTRQNVLRAPSVRILAHTSVKPTISMWSGVVPEINPNIAVFVIDSKWTLPNYVPAAILLKIKKSARIVNTSRQGNYKPFELPPVQYDEKITEEISQLLSNVTVLNNVSDVILSKLNKPGDENSLEQDNYNPFVLPVVQYDEEEVVQPDMILSYNVPAAPPLHENYTPFELPKDSHGEKISKDVSIDLDNTTSASLAQKVIDDNRLIPNVNLSNYNTASLCLGCRSASGNVIELDCLHVFCPRCLIHSISDVDNMFCPFKRGKYECTLKLDDDDLKNVLEMYNKLF